MSTLELDVDACRGRQRRLLNEMQRLNLDLVVVTQIEHLQWLSGVKYRWFFQPAAVMSADGRLTLVAPNQAPDTSASDDVLTYEAQWHSTLRNDQRQACSQALLDAGIIQSVRRIGVEFSRFSQHLSCAVDGELVDIEPQLFQLRRRKDADELALIRKAISGTEKMYERARAIIKPGISEIEVFNQLQAAAVEEFDEMLTGTGNDYQCGSRGGLPRGGRVAEAGELYILDLGPAFRGYFADNCRTIAVTDVSDEQRVAWEHVTSVFQHVEESVKPGKSAQQLFHEVQAMLDKAPVGTFDHHLGHGIGLFPHEAPHLNPHWDDTFEVGDVFTAEPGLYTPQLEAGMRIENNYRVTESGVELLTDFTVEL